MKRNCKNKAQNNKYADKNECLEHIHKQINHFASGLISNSFIINLSLYCLFEEFFFNINAFYFFYN